MKVAAEMHSARFAANEGGHSWRLLYNEWYTS